MSSERALNFDQWKTFSEDYKPMKVWLWPIKVWLWLVYKFTEKYCRSRLFSEFIQTPKWYPTSLDQNRYPNLKPTSHIKFFMWTNLLEILLLVNISYLSLRL